MKCLNFLLIFCSVAFAKTLDDYCKVEYDKYKNSKTSSSSPSFFQSPGNDTYASFKENFLKMNLQKIKFYCGKSNFLMKMNPRFAESKNRVAKSWNGLVLPKLQDKALVPRVLQPNFPPAPESLDYRDYGFVTPIKDQGFYCSSCYAFSANCALEGQAAKNHGVLRELSEQNIVDCSSSHGNFGCYGGYMAASYQYVVDNMGIANSSTYPYNGNENQCSYSPSLAAETATNYNFLTGDEEYIKRALAAIGPLAVGMFGNVDSFFYYGNGIYDDPNCNGPLDHAVCLIGYGIDNTTSPPTKYWIVKNSWSEEWGEGGYFRIVRGSNLCGITNYVIYPNVEN